MRIIKFRAWDKEFKKFIRSSHCVEFDGSVHKYKLGCVIPMGDTVELNQWTGLLDKNGKEIYEGDIQSMEVQDPETGAYEEEIWEVKYENCYFNCNTEAEIIGNIY